MITSPAETVALYTSRQMWLADVLGVSPLGGAILVALNCRRLGDREGARAALGWGMVGTAALLAFVELLSWRSPLPWMAVAGLSLAVQRLVDLERRTAAARRLASGAATPSSWVAAGIGLVCGVALVAVIAVLELAGRPHIGQ